MTLPFPAPGPEIALGDLRLGGRHPLLLIAGPCVVEGEEFTVRLAGDLARIAGRVGLPFVFKASYDKANRTSGTAHRGPGLEEGLRVLQRVREAAGVPILSDVHSVEEARTVGPQLDVIQIPAFLCRQTDLVEAAAETGRPVNLKKGQFVSPYDIGHAAAKAWAVGNRNVAVTERGFTFGYRNLVVDFRGFLLMHQAGLPVIFDGTHSVQTPGGRGDASGGDREMIPTLCLAAAAAGMDGLFLEVHPDPDRAPSDGPNMLPLAELESLLRRVVATRAAALGG